jgi:hypothetical protein
MHIRQLVRTIIFKNKVSMWITDTKASVKSI